MRTTLLLVAALILGAPTMADQAPTKAAPTGANPKTSPIAIAIHGGAGVIERATMTPEREAAYRAALEASLRAGHAVLAAGGSSLDAVTTAVKVLEDSPLFNAGKGAVFTFDGRNEMDAAIMDGATRRAGAVAGISRIRNPIELARAVMERSPHVMMVGEGAEKFAVEIGMPLVDPSYFHTDERWQQLQKAKAALAADPQARLTGDAPGLFDNKFDTKFGTVGAVALDRAGHLAAATSTGGMTAKRWGRVGDAPIIGAGTWADDATVAVSATGHGELFIRNAVAHDIAALYAYKGLSVQAAADEVVMRKLVAAKGEGGVIALDRKGHIAQPFNSVGMYRGSIGVDGRLSIAIFRDEASAKPH